MKYVDEDNLNTDDVEGMLKFLAAKSFKQDETNIDFQTLDYIKKLEKRAEDIESLVEVLQSDKQKNAQEKAAFEERKKRAGEPYQTSGFDKKGKRLDDLLSLIASRAGEGNERPIKNVDSEKSKASTKPTEADASNNKTENPVEQDSAIANSEAEVQAIMGVLESVRPDIEQLFAMSRCSLSMKQATGYLLISNQRMINSTGIYAEVLKNIQNVEQIERAVAVYDQQIDIDYGSSMSAINVIRQKAQALPTTLKGPMLTYCQNIENALGQILSIAQKKDGSVHNTSPEKLATDNQELEDALSEELSMQ